MDNQVESVDKYICILRDLCYNSKSRIKMLTQLAAEGMEHAEDIFEAIKVRLQEVPINAKLPILYLMDAIIKSVGGTYKTLFCKDIVAILCQVYFEVDQQTQKQLVELRETWNNVLPPNRLRRLDISISCFDSAWPYPTYNRSSSTFIPKAQPVSSKLPEEDGSTSSSNPTVLDMQRRIVEIENELLDIQERRLELDRYEARIKSQQKHIRQNADFNTCTTASRNLQINTNSDKLKTNPQNAVPENPRRIGDSGLFHCQQQQRENSVITSKVDTGMDSRITSSFSETVITKRKDEKDLISRSKFSVPKGTKRSSEDAELSVSKKAKYSASMDKLISGRSTTPPSQIIYAAAEIFRSDVKPENEVLKCSFGSHTVKRY